MEGFDSLIGGSILAIVALAVCAPVLFLAAAGGIGYLFYRSVKKATALREAALTWPSVPGVVVRSDVEVNETPSLDPNGVTIYRRSELPVIEYVYRVAGQEYHSQTVRAGDRYSNFGVSANKERILAAYPAGATVTVYYNPENPSEAALER